MGPQSGDYEDGIDESGKNEGIEDENNRPVDPSTPVLLPGAPFSSSGPPVTTPTSGSAGGKGRTGGKTSPTSARPRDPPSKDELDENHGGENYFEINRLSCLGKPICRITVPPFHQVHVTWQDSFFLSGQLQNLLQTLSYPKTKVEGHRTLRVSRTLRYHFIS